MPHAYTVTIEGERDIATLRWLDARGYAGDILNLAEEVESSDERLVLGLSEPSAWGFRGYIDSDPNAFLSSCGSETLSAALIDLWQSIV